MHRRERSGSHGRRTGSKRSPAERPGERRRRLIERELLQERRRLAAETARADVLSRMMHLHGVMAIEGIMMLLLPLLMMLMLMLLQLLVLMLRKVTRLWPVS